MSVIYLRFIERSRLIHIHGIGPALTAPLARLLGMKVVVTHHGTDYARAKWGRVARWALRFGESTALGSAHAVIVVSQSMTDLLKQRHPESALRLHYIPNGSGLITTQHPDDYSKDILTEFGLSSNSYLLAVGRLVPEKGFDDLITAFQNLETPLKLVIAGRADHEDAYAKKLLQRASPSVCFVGFQSRARLKILYDNMALFVMPSHHEGLPIAALEAASAHKPMLLSDIQPNQDVGLPAQNYFRTGDIADLTSKLGAPFSDFDIDASAILRRFDWDIVANKTLEIYEAVSAKSTCPSLANR